MNKNSVVSSRANLINASRRHFVVIAAAAIVSTGALTATVVALNPDAAVSGTTQNSPSSHTGLNSGSGSSGSSSSGISGSTTSHGSHDGASNAS